MLTYLKKTLLITLSFLLVFTMLFVEFVRVEAGSVKVVYKTVEGLGEATMKSIQARKGYQIAGWETVGSPPPPATPSPSQVFTQSMSKTMQDVASDSFDTISGQKFDKTPMKGMPGWLKVTLGTAAFVTSADLLFDLFSKVEDEQPLEYPTNDLTGRSTTSPVIRSNLTSNGERYMHYASDGYTLMTSSGNIVEPGGGLVLSTIRTGSDPVHTWFTHSDHSDPNWDGRVSLRYYSNASQTSTSGVTYSYRKNNSSGSFDYDNPTGRLATKSVVIPKEVITQQPVPEVDTSKQQQVLIVPDPAVWDTPEKVEQAISQNWDMVSNPERWFEQNPETDPDYEPNPQPTPTDQPKFVPNPNFNPTEEPSSENPMYQPNPNWTPETSMQDDPTAPDTFNPINGEGGSPPRNRCDRDEVNITEKFPFSLPFDLYYILSAVYAEPKTPVITLDETLDNSIGGFGIPIQFEHDMSYLDPYMKFFRILIQLGFAFFLIMTTRKLLGGGG